MLNTAVIPANQQNYPAAKALAAKWQLPFFATLTELSQLTQFSFVLQLSDEHLALISLQDTTLKPLYVDFLEGKQAHRQQFGGRELLLQAIKLKSRPLAEIRILDATAGLGRDAFVLASAGCQVTMVEYSPVVAALLEDGMWRYQVAAPAVTPLIWELHQTQTEKYLAQSDENSFDVIYLDPMFPPQKKSASVKKEMRLLRELLRDEETLDPKILFDFAWEKAGQRVVVKRPRLAPALTDRTPSFVITGSAARFDCYQKNNSSNKAV